MMPTPKALFVFGGIVVCLWLSLWNDRRVIASTPIKETDQWAGATASKHNFSTLNINDNDNHHNSAKKNSENNETKKRMGNDALIGNNNNNSSSLAGKSVTITEDDDERAFSQLDIFVSAFPGNNDTSQLNGFAEMRETLFESMNFFWPEDNFRLTVVLDNTVCKNNIMIQPHCRKNMTSVVRNLFPRTSFHDKISVKFNPRTNTDLYRSGYYIQQLIYFWADNFTDASYIGFVDDDTIFTRVVHSTELFDPKGRPRAIVKHMSTGFGTWMQSGSFAVQRKVLINGMTNFPIIVKREHLAFIRETILRAHPSISTFDEFYQRLLKEEPSSQFCIMMDILYHSKRDEYSWHFEESRDGWGRTFRHNAPRAAEFVNRFVVSGPPEISNVTDSMLEPFPRVAVHGPRSKETGKVRSLENRRSDMEKILKAGYCYSMVNQSGDDLETQRRCHAIYQSDPIYEIGEWNFGKRPHPLMQANRTAVELAHERAMSRNVQHAWDTRRLHQLFHDG